MIITEIVKNFMKQPGIEDKISSGVEYDKQLMDLSNNDLYPNTGAFFDDNNSSNYFNQSDTLSILSKQKDKIMKYRQLAQNPEVAEAVDEITNEIIFSFESKHPFKVTIDEENEKLVKAIEDKFKKVCKLMNLDKNTYEIVKRGYIDGQLKVHCAYDDKTTKNGLKSIKLIEPCMLYFDVKTNTYKYMDESSIRTSNNDIFEYSIEELVGVDFGLYDNKINLSYLDYAIKPANVLKTLEDLLIPMRFSRSISRRVFNVDIGDLPTKRGAEVMRDHQQKFKYKKFYNSDTGEVSNQQHITSMVEDYWFANRSGGKGTQVDLLDETGNLGELNDIIYFAKKLYRSLKIPSSRISLDPDADKEYDWDTSRTTKEDMKFFMLISRLRRVYSELLKEILRREVISSGIMTEDEWLDKEDFIEIEFVNENMFIEKMKIDTFVKKIEIFGTVAEHQGKLFSVEYLLSEIFNMSREEIEEMMKTIQKEEKDPLFKKFYIVEDDI